MYGGELPNLQKRYLYRKEVGIKMNKNTLKVGQKVKFDKEKRFNWTVQAVREQYAILTATLAGKGYYTIIDFNHNIRSSGTSWGLGHETRQDCEMSMLALFGEHPNGIEQELSNRHEKPLCIAAVKDMQNLIEMKDLKIKLKSHNEFKQASDAFIELGYFWGGCTVPHTAPYLFTYSDGRILADYFDVEDADLSSPNSAFGHFTNHRNTEITLDELLNLAIWSKAPAEAYAWERFPNERCVWHCRKDNQSFDKKAPDLKIKSNTLWRDPEKQKEAIEIKSNLNKQLKELNITLV